MSDWNRDLSSDHDEPTVVPSGCEPADRGESCGKTDCPSCGLAAAHLLYANARADTRGVIALGREILCLRYRPEGVTLGDLARVRFLHPLRVDKADRGRAYAWAEGVLAALNDERWLQSRDFGGDPSEQAAFVIGYALVQLYLFREHLTKLEAQAARETWMPSPWITPDEFTPCTSAEKAQRLGIPSAAGDLSPHRRPTAQSGQRAESGPGSESRAQHRGNRGR